MELQGKKGLMGRNRVSVSDNMSHNANDCYQTYSENKAFWSEWARSWPHTSRPLMLFFIKKPAAGAAALMFTAGYETAQASTPCQIKTVKNKNLHSRSPYQGDEVESSREGEPWVIILSAWTWEVHVGLMVWEKTWLQQPNWHWLEFKEQQLLMLKSL